MRFEPDLALVETVEGDRMGPPALQIDRITASHDDEPLSA
jgi:hypothetical protein